MFNLSALAESGDIYECREYGRYLRLILRIWGCYSVFAIIKNTPKANRKMLRTPKNPVKSPNAELLVNVKYVAKAPIIMIMKPKNFSANVIPKPPPSSLIS
jgi:hypothetical protein